MDKKQLEKANDLKKAIESVRWQIRIMEDPNRQYEVSMDIKGNKRIQGISLWDIDIEEPLAKLLDKKKQWLKLLERQLTEL